MKSSRTATQFLAVGAVGLAVVAASAGSIALAAPVAWGSAQNITGDSDVTTNGTLLYAYQFGNSRTGTTTVNGVSFEPFNVATESTTVTTGNVVLSAAASGSVMYSFDELASVNAPYANLSVAYQGLLNSAVLSSIFDNPNGAPLDIQLGGLTPGSSYVVQWWSCAADYLYPYQTVALGSPNVTLSSNTANATGGLGQYVIGTFTAAGASTTITLQGLTMNSPPYDLPTLNALQVRAAAVPEPSTYAMALAGIACCGWQVMRRRRTR